MLFRSRTRIIFMNILCFFCSLILLFSVGETIHAAPGLQQTGDVVTVVIDPGHGGENHGTTENGYLEKSMNMTTALAMYEELCLFEGIQVFLTHTDDVDMSLKERALFAADKQADLLISLHYNASETHRLYGSEVWISLQPEYHAYGYQFATVAMREFRDMGMQLRGIKTKPNSKGEDYYGIIREAVALDVPAVILEHCHVDHPEDSLHCDTQEEQRAFGIADAHSVAKYFGLKSSILGLDYSDYGNTLPEVSPTELLSRTRYDDTPPEYCEITLKEAFYSEDRVLLQVRASDSDTNLIYYSYSLDGGNTFVQPSPWPEGDILTGEFSNEFLVELAIPDQTDPSICFRAYNPYDLFATSNVLTFPQTFQKEAQIIPSASEPELEDKTDLLIPADNSGMEIRKATIHTILSVLTICIGIVFVLFIILLILYLVTRKLYRRGD